MPAVTCVLGHRLITICSLGVGRTNDHATANDVIKGDLGRSHNNEADAQTVENDFTTSRRLLIPLYKRKNHIIQADPHAQRAAIVLGGATYSGTIEILPAHSRRELDIGPP